MRRGILVFHVVTNGHFKFNQYKWSRKSQRCAPQTETGHFLFSVKRF